MTRQPPHLRRRTARHARLRYASDDRPGIRRVRAGSGFRYVTPSGGAVGESALKRIRKLAIPPAYRDVWISPDPLGHVQATGRDARGRKQFRYHARWREVRDEAKFDRMISFSRKLPAIRATVRRDLARGGLPRRKVVAAVVSLLDSTSIRVGNDEYAKDNHSYGLTTLRDRHVEIEGDRILFEFRGKGGKLHRSGLRDRRLARVVSRCQSLPGAMLFQYVDPRGRRHSIGSKEVNDYVRQSCGEEFTAKDFRTWSGTVWAARSLAQAKQPRNPRGRTKLVLAALDEVAARLNNTRAVCRKYYVHPALLEGFERSGLAPSFRQASRSIRRQRGLSALERALVSFLAARDHHA